MQSILKVKQGSKAELFAEFYRKIRLIQALPRHNEGNLIPADEITYVLALSPDEPIMLNIFTVKWALPQIYWGIINIITNQTLSSENRKRETSAENYFGKTRRQGSQALDV